MPPYATSTAVAVPAKGESLGDPRDESAARLLIDAIRELARARSIEAIAQVVKNTAGKLVGADGTTFVLREGEHCLCVDEDAIAPLWKGQKFSLTGCVVGLVMEHGAQVAISDIYADARVVHENYRSTFVRSLVLTPVRGRACTAVIGTFWATSHTATAQELSLLQDLADATAVATENAELYAELELRVEQRTEELREANRDLEAFSYSVAHDLRAPLAAMLVTRSALERSYGASLDGQALKLLQDMERSGQRMGELIGGLLQFARTSRVEVLKRVVDLSGMAAGIVATLRQQHLSRRLNVLVEPGISAYADPTMMEVVLSNLLHNAFKYTRERAIAEIQVGRVREEGRSVFYVRDNGAGFDQSSASDLFLPFKRFHAAIRFEGHGVGLATVARIITKHGGSVWGESRPEGGATFFFSLPDEKRASARA